MKFSDFSDGLTFEDVQVGLDPSAGSGLVTLDSDCNGVFKISDKDTQVLKVVQSDGTHTLTQTFDLSGLTIAPIPSTITPDTATFDLNESGANHKDLVFAISLGDANETVDKLFVQTGAEPSPETDIEAPPVAGSTTLWTYDATDYELTLKPEIFHEQTVGTLICYAMLTNGEILPVTITVEDTT